MNSLRQIIESSQRVGRLYPGVFVEDAVHESVNSPDHVRLWEINHEHPKRHEDADGRREK